MTRRPTHDDLRRQGRAAERADVLSLFAVTRAGLTELIAFGKVDAEGAGMLDRRLDALAEQIAGGLHVREGEIK